MTENLFFGYFRVQSLKILGFIGPVNNLKRPGQLATKAAPQKPGNLEFLFVLFLDDGNDRTKRILGLRGRLTEIMTLKRGICRVVGPGG